MEGEYPDVLQRKKRKLESSVHVPFGEEMVNQHSAKPLREGLRERRSLSTSISRKLIDFDYTKSRSSMSFLSDLITIREEDSNSSFSSVVSSKSKKRKNSIAPKKKEPKISHLNTNNSADPSIFNLQIPDGISILDYLIPSNPSHVPFIGMKSKFNGTIQLMQQGKVRIVAKRTLLNHKTQYMFDRGM